MVKSIERDILEGRLDLIGKRQILLFLSKVRKAFEEEPPMISLKPKRVVFVGDTHGDFDAASKILETYSSHTIVFLGDYVDRAINTGDDVKNILLLLAHKLKNKKLILLRGNHEDSTTNDTYGFLKSVEKYWDKTVWRAFNKTFEKMPLAAVTRNIIALHGSLPDVESLKDIQKIPKGLVTGKNKIFDQLLWNDCVQKPGRIISKNHRGTMHAISTGQEFFEEKMKKLGKKILVRGHDPNAKGWMYNKRCLTLQTSHLYEDMPGTNHNCEEPVKGRMIAVVSNGKVEVERI